MHVRAASLSPFPTRADPNSEIQTDPTLHVARGLVKVIFEKYPTLLPIRVLFPTLPKTAVL